MELAVDDCGERYILDVLALTLVHLEIDVTELAACVTQAGRPSHDDVDERR